MGRQFYSIRKGTKPNLSGFPLCEIFGLFVRLYNQMN